jgi:hypothetical protein
MSKLASVRSTFAWPFGRQLEIELDEESYNLATESVQEGYRSQPMRVLSMDSELFTDLLAAMHREKIEARVDTSNSSVLCNNFRVSFHLRERRLVALVSVRGKLWAWVTALGALASVAALLLLFYPQRIEPWALYFAMATGFAVVVDRNSSLSNRLAAALVQVARAQRGVPGVASAFTESARAESSAAPTDAADANTLDEEGEPVAQSELTSRK